MRGMRALVPLLVLSVALVSGTRLAAQDAAVLKELSRLEDDWATAFMKKDGAAVGRLLSDRFLSMSEDGRVFDKAALVQEVNATKDTYVSASNSGYKVQVFGETAIIVGAFTGVVKTADGTETRRSVWTDTWIRQPNGQWLCVASQSTPLPQ